MEKTENKLILMALNILIKTVLVLGVFITFVTSCQYHRLYLFKWLILFIFGYVAWWVDKKFILKKRKK